MKMRDIPGLEGPCMIAAAEPWPSSVRSWTKSFWISSKRRISQMLYKKWRCLHCLHFWFHQKSGVQFGMATEWLLLLTAKPLGAASFRPGSTITLAANCLPGFSLSKKVNCVLCGLSECRASRIPSTSCRGAEWPIGWVSKTRQLITESSGITPSIVWGKHATCVNRRPIPTHEKICTAALSTGHVKGWTVNTHDHMHTAASGTQHVIPRLQHKPWTADCWPWSASIVDSVGMNGYGCPNQQPLFDMLQNHVNRYSERSKSITFAHGHLCSP